MPRKPLYQFDRDFSDSPNFLNFEVKGSKKRRSIDLNKRGFTLFDRFGDVMFRGKWRIRRKK